jgi:hypothetical protein
MRVVVRWFSVGLVAAASMSMAQTNSCGSGWNEYLVPDQIPVLRCDFGSSCAAHDTCYSKCLTTTDGDCAYRRCQKGGDLHQSAKCEADEALLKSWSKAQERKLTCDIDFYEAMRRANQGRWACEALAIVYRDAVKQWGEGFFGGFGQTAAVAAWQQPQADYDRALATFFKEGQEADFRRFVEANDSGKATANLCGRLAFTASRGLHNVEGDEHATCQR